MPAHYSVKEASQILGFSTNTIYKYVNDGTIKARRTQGDAGRFRISKSAIETFLGHPIEQSKLQSIQPKTTPSPSPKTLTLPDYTEPSAPSNSAITLKTTRALIIISLIMILLDVLVSRDFSITEQIIRLLFLVISILMAYQFGGLTHVPTPPSQEAQS